MAIRLSVIMIHTPPAGSGKQALSEAIVGELIGLPGIDLTLIGPIESLDELSTDRLSIDAITGDVALLDWHPPEQSISDLATIGFQGRRAPHANDPEPPEKGGSVPRRIYAFDISRFTDASELVSSLIQMRDHRQVRTVSMSLTPPPHRSTVSRSTANSTRAPNPDPAENRAPSPNSTKATPPEGPATPVNPVTSGKQESINLDELLDQLDQLDP